MKRLFLVLFLFPLCAHTQVINISNNESVSNNPRIVTCKSIRYVLWIDNENGNYGIQFRLYANGDWSDVKKINTFHSIYLSSICMEDSTIVDLLWRDGVGTNYRLMYGRIVDSTLVDSIEISGNENILFSSFLFDRPTRTLQVSWDVSSGDSVYTYYSVKDSNGTWSVRQVITTHSISHEYPRSQLVKDKNHDVLCLWYSADSMSINMLRKNADSWIEGTSLTTESMGIGPGFIAGNDDSLNVHIVTPCQQMTCPCNYLSYSKWDGSIWSTLETVPSNDNYAYYTEHVSPEICFSKDCYPVISWEQHSWDINMTMYAKFIGTAVKTDVGWHVNTSITTHPDLENPSIAVDNQDFINYAWQDSSDGDYDIYFYRTSLLTTVESDRNPIVPNEVCLYQNYPNPFNPATSISFHLSSTTLVSLKIYDLLGKEVADLISEKMEAGDHSVVWDASRMSSGIYFYRLQAGSFFSTKALVFLK
jgi:hypothetical protein